MATQILLPKLGFSMSDGVVREWFVANGGTAVEGELLYAVESEKSVQEIEAPASGTLTILTEIGETYPVGHVLGEIT